LVVLVVGGLVVGGLFGGGVGVDDVDTVTHRCRFPLASQTMWSTTPPTVT
jgi:hypothetical protein